MEKFRSRAALALGLCCLAYGLGCFLGAGPLSLLWAWPVLGAALTARGLLGLRLGPSAAKKAVLWIFDAAFLLFLAAFSVFSGFVLAHADDQAPENCGAVLILGAGVRGETPTPLLQKRIDAAAEYLAENPGTLAVCSGGLGDGASITEAECIARGLRASGIAENRLILETRSTSTEENIRYSLALLPPGTAPAAVVTNGFHLFRAELLLRSAGRTACGQTARGGGLLNLHFTLREFAAFTVGALRGDFT